MALDLTQFHDTFFEESFEALDSMEAALLNLAEGAPDPERINTIFRVAHSMKGGSATFGFTEIASFTHSLETLLDELRGGRMQVTRPICDMLLKSVDVMRDMLRAVQSKKPIDSQVTADLQFDIEAVTPRKGAAAPPAAPISAPAAAPSVARTEAGEAAAALTPPSTPTSDAAAPHWRIRFVPNEQLMERGNDPARLLRELAG